MTLVTELVTKLVTGLFYLPNVTSLVAFSDIRRGSVALLALVVLEHFGIQAGG